MTAWTVALILASLAGAGWAVVAIRAITARRTGRARHRR